MSTINILTLKKQRPRKPKKKDTRYLSLSPKDMGADKATPNEAGSQGTTLSGGPRRQETIGDTIAQTRFENTLTLVPLVHALIEDMFDVNDLDGDRGMLTTHTIPPGRVKECKNPRLLRLLWKQEPEPGLKSKQIIKLDEEKARIICTILKAKKKNTTAKREEKKRNKHPTRAQQRISSVLSEKPGRWKPKI
ncbi:hypothetical protein Tco_1514974 [Tanacetum coccineum]